MNVFDLFKKIDYAKLLMNFDPANPSKEQQDIVLNYKTPSRLYIKESARNLEYDEVPNDTLKYILVTCHQCPMEIKYHTALVTIYKLFIENKEDPYQLIATAKKDLANYLTNDVSGNTIDLSFLNEIIVGYSKNFFYVLEITIGNNTIYKYGITTTSPRKRIQNIKADIKSNYSNQAISIVPMIVLHTLKYQELEDEVKVSLSENNIRYTDYNFNGATETFYSKDKLATIDGIILPTADKFGATLLYPQKTSVKVLEDEQEPEPPSLAELEYYDELNGIYPNNLFDDTTIYNDPDAI